MPQPYLHLLATALGAAPDEASADEVLAVMKNTGAPVAEWGLHLAASEAAGRPGVHVFDTLDRHGLLLDHVADAFGKSAALRENEALLARWSEHPQAKKMVLSSRGKEVAMSLLRGGGRANEEQLHRAFRLLFRQDLKWDQGTLDVVFRSAFTKSNLTRQFQEEIIEATLRKGANPAARPEGDDPRAKPAALLFAHKANVHDSIVLREIITALHCSKYWEEMLQLSDRGRSFAMLLAVNAPVAELVDGLDSAKKPWWDGDPYGLVDIISQRAHRDSGLLIAMCQRATETPVEIGLSPDSMGKVFSELFISSGKQSQFAQVRSLFWEGPARLMGCLWKDEGPWKSLCAKAHAFESSPEDSDSENARQVFMQSAVLEFSTPQATAQLRRRTL